MKLRNRTWSLVVALVLPVAFAGAHSGQRLATRSESETANRQKIAEDFASALLTAKDNYAGQVDYNKITKASIVGMLRTLDPHSMYLDRQQWDEFQNDQRSRYFGIGSTIAQRSNKVYILSPTEGTPSYKAGLRYGDQITEINGEATTGWTVTQVRSKLLGPEGTVVNFKVARAGSPNLIDFKLSRGSVPLPSIANYFMFGNGVGYVNLERGFNTTTYDETRAALTDLRKQGMTSLVLDLRGNHGGLVDQANKVVNHFTFRGQKILSMRGRPGVFPSRESVSNNNSPDDYPIVVLVDRGSASAAEIVAGALQDHDRARIVGENSFGKGLVQNPFPLTDGSALILTTGHYYTPSGRLIQREYSGRSFYDYYLKRGDKDAANKTDEKHTDSGRPVYGGGGIEPDVLAKVRFTPREIELQNYWRDPVFAFVQSLVAGQLPALAGFKIEHPPDHHHRLAATDYVVDEKMLGSFKTFLKEHGELKIDSSRVDNDAEFVKRGIRYELVTAAFGIETAYQVLLEGDEQMKRAIAEIPTAKIMAEDIRRLRASRDGELRRN
ncbi:MAG TPA: S41 family peptidase [Blastocatellia bacterium]|nr:S41 family peptidase [Blastocatellia bacterium]